MIQQVKRKRFLPIALILLLAVVGPVGEALALPTTNLSFESGLTGFSYFGSALTVPEFFFDPYGDGYDAETYYPSDGVKFLQLDSDLIDSDPWSNPGTRDPSIVPTDTSAYQVEGFDYDGTPIPDTWTGTDGAILQTSLDLGPGMFFSFDFIFLSFENLYSDFSLFLTSSSTTTEQNVLSTSEMIGGTDTYYQPEIGATGLPGDLGGGWQTYTFLPFGGGPFSGNISFVASNGDQVGCDPYDYWTPCDTSYPSVLLVDNLLIGLAKPAAPVPEPGTLVMMAIGLGGLGLSRRRRSEG